MFYMRSIKRFICKTSRPSSPQLVKVHVKQGVVVGQSNTLPNGQIYHSFQGIPYALPPLGALRFRSPQPLAQFNKPELLCVKERDICHQRDPITGQSIGSENCLHLNVYAPKCKRKSIPVIVFLHGGGFWFGHGNSDYYLPLFLMEEQIVVVTLNYRLGALGFLALPEEGIWGNAGLKDQRLALQWIQNNIAQFNGDPKNITLMGESAGAASVHLHMYSQYEHKLFHKAIMQSSTANALWVLQENAPYNTRRLAELLGYEGSLEDSKQLLQFLQTVQPSNILEKTLDVLTPQQRRFNLPFVFKPVIEDTQSIDAFICEPLMNRLTQSNFVNMPVIMGYNSAEGLATLVDVMKKIDLYENDFERLVPRDLRSFTEKDIKVITKRIRDFYLAGQALHKSNLNQMKDLLTDIHFVYPLQKAAQFYVKYQLKAPLYFYRFDYVGDRNFYKTLLQMGKFDGACHGDELFYLFQNVHDDLSTFNVMDLKVSKHMSKLWANFAYTGNPTPASELTLTAEHLENPLKCFWEKVTHVNINHDANDDDDFYIQLKYLDINGGDGEMKFNPDKERMEFWRSIYKEYPQENDFILSSKL